MEDQVAQELRKLRDEVAALRKDVLEVLAPTTYLPNPEIVRQLREAHASGDRARIREANKLVNGSRRRR